MLRLVCYSTALILLAKCDLLSTVGGNYEIVAPPSVIKEVASSVIQKKHPDAKTISDAVDSGIIKVRRCSSRKLKFPIRLHPGERDALKLALEAEGSMLATDDGKAIKAARLLGIPFIITPRIVTELFRLGEIPFSVARVSIEKLGIIGRYSPDILAEALLSLRGEK